MSKTHLILISLLVMSLLLFVGCPESGAPPARDNASEVDPHAGHAHDEPEAAEDSHAGHTDDEPEEAEEHDEHADEDGHDEHDEDEEEAEAGAISLSIEQIRELGIASAPAGPGSLGRELELTGEAAINEDAVTHVTPRIAGIISKVHHKLGDHVRAGEALMELDSIELAEVSSEYLALLSRIELARQTLEREEMLLGKGISAEQDYLEAKQAYDEELINKRSLEQKLAALGLSQPQIEGLTDKPDPNLTGYTVTSPVGGEILEKHASLGEMVGPETEVYTIGNMDTVWVRLNIYQQDFADIRVGMEVTVDPGHGVEPARGVIDYIEPLIGEQTRTAVARVVLKRTSHVFRPGLFVTGYVEVDGESVDLIVPRNAMVDLDQDKLIFVRSGTSFEPRVVSVGRQTSTSIEIIDGIEPGEEIVVEGAFQLKAELMKGNFDPHAGHAH